jgi:hypothetical protein
MIILCCQAIAIMGADQSQGAISELAREWPFGSELGATVSVWKKITKILTLNLKS